MAGNLLSFYARINAPFLHAYSEAGTEALLSQIKFSAGCEVLELGCGTGATLAKVASRYRNIVISALEVSPQMLTKTRQRLKFCGLEDRVNLKTYEKNFHFPFADSSFDIVYAESVIAFQDEPQMRHLVKEIFRILKPGGKLHLNETLWLDSVSPDEIKQVNIACLDAFGIIQANEKIRGKSEWTRLLFETGFSTVSFTGIKPVPSSKNKKTSAEKLSSLYSFAGRMKKIRPSLISESKSLHRAMDSIFPEKKQYLTGILISCIR